MELSAVSNFIYTNFSYNHRANWRSNEALDARCFDEDAKQGPTTIEIRQKYVDNVLLMLEIINSCHRHSPLILVLPIRGDRKKWNE